MQKPVYASKVDEHAIVGNVLYNAIQDGTLVELLQCLRLLGLAFLLELEPARHYDVRAAVVQLDYLDRNLLADQGINVLYRPEVYVRARQKCLDTVYVHKSAALGLLADHALHSLAFFKDVFELVP